MKIVINDEGDRTTPTPTPTLKATLEGPPGSAVAPTSADGHSGSDHPPYADEVGYGVSFGEAPDPHQLQLGEQGRSGVLPTPLVPTHTGSYSTGTTSLRSKSPVLTPREHGCDNNADHETLARSSDSYYSYASQWVNPTGQRKSVTGSTIVFAEAANSVCKSFPSLGTHDPEEAVGDGEWRPRAEEVVSN